MKKMSCLFKTIIVTIIFIGVAQRALAFDTWWHAECTRKAMVANGFSSDARLATQFSNYLTDVFPAFNLVNEKLIHAGIQRLRLKGDLSYEYMHFDAIFTRADIEQNWKLLLNNTIQTLRKYANNSDIKPGFRLPILFNIIGASLHTVQDFYSHSNWVNLQVASGVSPIPIWYDLDSLQRSELDLYTGAYPDGSAKGKKNHGDLNKDCSARHLNKQAVEVAERASINWVKQLMDSVTSISWSELKSYNIQNNIVMKRFLVTLDATFLTSSSIIPNHFDGPQPVKFVFSADKDLTKERSMAGVALHSTITQYAENMLISENTFQLPSPYWVGHQAYHITRDIAAGLKLNGKKYSGKEN
jgi:hypothetical protein